MTVSKTAAVRSVFVRMINSFNRISSLLVVGLVGLLLGGLIPVVCVSALPRKTQTIHAKFHGMSLLSISSVFYTFIYRELQTLALGLED